jgi:hypothetical protein
MTQLPDRAPEIAAGLALAGAAAVAPLVAPLLAVVSVVLVPILKDRFRLEREQGRNVHPAAAYLLNLQEQLTPRSTVARISNAAERVVARSLEDAVGP